MTDSAINQRHDAACSIAHEAGKLACDYFAKLEQLEILSKGVQDYVSIADRDVETLIRRKIAELFPDDGIIGEEHAATQGKSGFTWVIDPIDGTSNFVRGAADWVVAIAVVHDNQTKIAVTYEAMRKETFRAIAGQGAFVNDKPIHVSKIQSLDKGVLGIGYSTRQPYQNTLKLLDSIFANQAGIYHNASGASMLAQVAAGKLIGFCEFHMNCWDCVGGLLLIKEAGGRHEQFDLADMLTNGGRVFCACPGVYDKVIELANSCN